MHTVAGIVERHIGARNRNVLMKNPASIFNKRAARRFAVFGFFLICVGFACWIWQNGIFWRTIAPVLVDRGKVVDGYTPEGGAWRIWCRIVNACDLIAE